MGNPIKYYDWTGHDAATIYTGQNNPYILSDNPQNAWEVARPVVGLFVDVARNIFGEVAVANLIEVRAAAKAAKAAEKLTRESIDDKLIRYLRNPEHLKGADKAAWFKQALGFTKENASELAKQIVFDASKAIETGVTEFGTKFNQVIPIKGANGKMIDVTFAWIKNKDGIIRLVTGIPTKQ